MYIVLTGFMSSGKTVCGRRLAELMGRDFFDSDVEIEANAGMTISEIFEKFGEEYFRNLETETIKQLSGKKDSVISTGGGAVLRKKNILALSENGIIVNLETNGEIIAERLGGGDSARPLTKGKSIDETIARFEARKPFYDNCDIKIKIDKDKGIEDTAKEILRILEDRYDSEIWSGRK